MVSDTPASDSPRQSAPPRGHWIGWLLLCLLIFGIVGAAAVRNTMRARSEPVPPPLQAAPQFQLLDQTGKEFSSRQLAGKPYVIDFIFTRCGGQCPMMTVRMRDLQKWLSWRGYHDFQLVTVTVDSDNDTTEVLSEYAQRFQIDTKNWTFLTGRRDVIYPMIQKGFLLGVSENQGAVAPQEEFIHSDRFVLVDAQGQIRDFFPATDDEQMKRIRRVIENLMREPKEISGAPGK